VLAGRLLQGERELLVFDPFTSEGVEGPRVFGAEVELEAGLPLRIETRTAAGAAEHHLRVAQVRVREAEAGHEAGR
jgi:hypothetical protein